MKYVVVSGGVVSGLGKGISISSLGVLLKASGLRVTSIKIDPYLVRGALWPRFCAADCASTRRVLRSLTRCACVWPAPARRPRTILLLQNVDAGTMSPFEHGEVFVLDDGGEVSATPSADYAAPGP